MSGEPAAQPAIARRVVTGTNANGTAVIVDDGPARTWVRRPTGTLVVDIWRLDELPSQASAEASLTEEVVLAPPARGVVVRVTTFPPDSEISPEAAAEYAAKMSEIYGEQPTAGDGPPAVRGMHSTETIDVMTVIEGELHMVMEEGETCLRAGDSVVQRGTRHAWQNRSDRPAKVVTTMMPATRP